MTSSPMQSQAFALSSYTLFSLAATALVLSTLFPEVRARCMLRVRPLE